MNPPESSQPATTVTGAYDRIAELWQGSRTAGAEFRERPFVDRLVAPLGCGAHVLDVGCGSGAPIGAYLVGKGYRITGLDGSARMLEQARQALPACAFIHGDMRTVDPGGPFDAIVAWDSVFHLPRGDHAALFRRFHDWLRPGGRLLLSLGGSGDEGFTSEMHGEVFFYSGHEPEVALAILRGAGLFVEHWEVDDPHSRGHIALLARRPAT